MDNQNYKLRKDKAFPSYEWNEPCKQMLAVGGMDLRDYFAAKAMQAMANAICSMDDLGIIKHRPDDIAQISYVYADAMMKAREQ